MLWFNGSCWCCVNSKSLFACHNADVDFRSFGLALTSSDEFLPRSNMVQSVHVAFQKEHVRWSRNVNTVKRGQKMYRVRELGPTNHIEGHALIQWILLVLCQQQESICMPECRCGFPFVWAGFDKLWRIPSAQQYGAKCACCVSKRTCQVVKKCQYRQERSENVQS